MCEEIRELEWKYFDPDNIQLQSLLEACDLRGSRVLEVGCGNGIFTLKLADHAKQVVAIDNDPGIIEAARQKAKEKIVSNVEFVAMDAQNLRLLSNSFDVVLCLWAINTVKHKEKALREAERVLKKGGRFLLMDFVESSIHYELARKLFPTKIRVMNSKTRYERPIKNVFQKIKSISGPIPLPIVFPNMDEALREAVGELEKWYIPHATNRRHLTQAQKNRILAELEKFSRDDGKVIVYQHIKLYLATKC
ncbi:MAG TPA: class I SAM-dependent methyltransferase [Nitrososphaera sp.]|jgi:SAM-dependent methyltransferase|nr:class I SAM-dependent methyltransferase [Nitrososphaera sp.]HEX2613952.1 class I SAM-dependent methyltransferase [Nitrososphaera sp.]